MVSRDDTSSMVRFVTPRTDDSLQMNTFLHQIQQCNQCNQSLTGGRYLIAANLVHLIAAEVASRRDAQEPEFSGWKLLEPFDKLLH